MAVRRRKVTRVRRVRRARRNPYPVAGLAINPRRRRRTTRTRTRAVARRNPRVRAVKRRRTSYRRNPAILGISLPPLQSVLFAGVGFIAPPIVEGFLSGFIPASLQSSTIGKYALRIGSVLALSFAAKQFVGAEQAKMVAIGGGAYVLTTAISEFAPGMIPGLSGYVPSNGMGAYITASGPTMQSLGMPQASFPGNVGSSNRIPSRFNRF